MTTAPSAVAGHVFVVHGRMVHIARDGAIVPTDRFFSVRPYWDALLGPDTGRRRPEGWARDGRRHGRIGDGRPLWFVDVGRSAPHHDVNWLVEGVAAVLAEAAHQLVERPEDRCTERLLPLLLLPVVGIGGGGFGQTRGEVVMALLDTAEEVARVQGVDIAFVTPDPSVHAAVQHLRRQRASWPLAADQAALAESLARRAMDGGPLDVAELLRRRRRPGDDGHLVAAGRTLRRAAASRATRPRIGSPPHGGAAAHHRRVAGSGRSADEPRSSSG